MNMKTLEFLTRQMDTSDTKREQKVRLFLRYLDAICKASNTNQDFRKIRSKLDMIAGNDCLEPEAISQALHIEPFLRELYSAVFGIVEYEGNFAEIIIRLGAYKNREDLIKDGKWIFKTRDEDCGNKRYYKKIFAPESIEYHFAGMYRCRNMEAHRVEHLPLLLRTELFLDILNAFIWSVYLNETAVRKFILFSECNLGNYFGRIKREYKHDKNYVSYILPEGKISRFGQKNTEEGTETIFDFYEECKNRWRLRLIGKAGMGKTTAIGELIQRDIATFEETQRIPVLIKLLEITTPSYSFENIISDTLEIDISLVKDLLRSGNINVYFDGVNEIALDANEQKALLRQIDKFIEEYGKAYIVISDRENNQIDLMNAEPTYYLLPLNDSQIHDFIYKNCKATPRDRICKEITRLLENFPNVKEAVRTPYMLKNLLEIAEISIEQLPQNPNDITGVLLNSIIKRELNEKREHLAKYAHELLKALASELPDDESEIVKEGEAKRIIKRQIERKSLDLSAQEAGNALRILIQMGILRKRGEMISFSSQDFKDYYFLQACQDED